MSSNLNSCNDFFCGKQYQEKDRFHKFLSPSNKEEKEYNNVSRKEKRWAGSGSGGNHLKLFQASENGKKKKLNIWLIEHTINEHQNFSTYISM